MSRLYQAEDSGANMDKHSVATPQLRSLDHSCLLRESYRDAAILQCLLTSNIFAEAHLNVGTLPLTWFVQPSNKSLAQIQLIIIGSDVVIFFPDEKMVLFKV